MVYFAHSNCYHHFDHLPIVTCCLLSCCHLSTLPFAMLPLSTCCSIAFGVFCTWQPLALAICYIAAWYLPSFHLPLSLAALPLTTLTLTTYFALGNFMPFSTLSLAAYSIAASCYYLIRYILPHYHDYLLWYILKLVTIITCRLLPTALVLASCCLTTLSPMAYFALGNCYHLPIVACHKQTKQINKLMYIQ